MTDTHPAIALLFDDTELGSQLRDALCERGARIVHEGGVASLDRDLLARIGADVLVVNLDDSADDALDQLYEAIDGDRPRVVFNDAQASRALTGWDRARWARHLAVKVLAEGDLDPPRPEHARGLDPLAVPAATAEAAAMLAMAGADDAEDGFAQELDDAEFPDANRGESASAESENLAAELEALLAEELPLDEETLSGPGLRQFDEEALPELHDGDFSEAAMDAADAMELPGSDVVPNVTTDAAAERAAAVEASLELSPLSEPALATQPSRAEPPPLPGAKSAVHAPSSWALLDDDEPTAPPSDKPDPATFGIEKVSAADFLAPDVERVAPDLEPVMNLQLVSIEEAIAPQAYVREHEMLLDDLDSALSRIVLLGAAATGTDSVCAFLAALPERTRSTFLLTQHMGKASPADLVDMLAAHCALPVRLAGQGGPARMGEVLVAPPGEEVRIRRDGSVDLLPNSAATQVPSIDASFSMAANVFGRDALAIVFAGRSTDGVAGAQAVHDRGGQVWVESSGEHFSDMVSGIFAERLVSFSGTPSQLAAHLIEVFP